jgi:deoxyribodipyrimidine photo-lyase
MIDIRREFQLNPDSTYFGGNVIYWMTRDQRVQDNWAMLKAKTLAESRQSSFAVVFCLTPDYPYMQNQHYRFMLDGLREVEDELENLKIPFFLLYGDPAKEITKFVNQNNIQAVVTDFSPLKYPRLKQSELAQTIDVPLIEVDTHNIVPCRTASHKEEFAARTIRPKINSLLDQFLVDIPEMGRQKFDWNGVTTYTDWDRVTSSYGEPNKHFPAGTKAANQLMQKFLTKGLENYSSQSNDPNKGRESNLSPYLNFGSISAQRLALNVREAFWSEEDINAFSEQLIIRKELTDNYCLYNDKYDSIQGAHNWAKTTLSEHWDDTRSYVYSYEQLESAKTHDELWNAAQLEMLKTGKMHNYMRMYWAKKILEWTENPEIAFETAISLNDKYALDGRDPNGYVGVAWSICGVHDRAWQKRPVFGKIRYMSYNGCKSKFNINEYVLRVLAI